MLSKKAQFETLAARGLTDSSVFMPYRFLLCLQLLQYLKYAGVQLEWVHLALILFGVGENIAPLQSYTSMGLMVRRMQLSRMHD